MTNDFLRQAGPPMLGLPLEANERATPQVTMLYSPPPRATVPNMLSSEKLANTSWSSQRGISILWFDRVLSPDKVGSVQSFWSRASRPRKSKSERAGAESIASTSAIPLTRSSLSEILHLRKKRPPGILKVKGGRPMKTSNAIARATSRRDSSGSNAFSRYQTHILSRQRSSLFALTGAEEPALTPLSTL